MARGHFEVMESMCDECLFSPGRIVSSRRMAEVLGDCAASDSHFVCHKATLAYGAGSGVCCRGFYDRDPGTTNLMRIAGRLGVVRFVPIPDVKL